MCANAYFQGDCHFVARTFERKRKRQTEGMRCQGMARATVVEFEQAATKLAIAFISGLAANILVIRFMLSAKLEGSIRFRLFAGHRRRGQIE
jgi:hypothetical protein